MALIKCPHCGGIVSDKAIKCPHCGNSPGKASLIQYGSKARVVSPTEMAAVTGKFFLLVAMFTSVELWTLYYLGIYYFEYGKLYDIPIIAELMWKYNLYDLPHRINMVVGLLIVILTVYGIIKLCKNKIFSWKFWTLSTLVSWGTTIVIYGITPLMRFYNYYHIDDIDAPLTQGQVAMIELAAALLSVILAVYGITTLCKSKIFSWKFWVFSIFISWGMSFAIKMFCCYYAD